jgi:hypothetical protein
VRLVRATSAKPQASSAKLLKQQATSFKPQATSVKLQATSDKLTNLEPFIVKKVLFLLYANTSGVPKLLVFSILVYEILGVFFLKYW